MLKGCLIHHISFLSISGYFLYTNSQFGKKDGAIASFVSPFIENRAICLQFYFWFQVRTIQFSCTKKKLDTFATKLELCSTFFFQPGNNAFKNLVFFAEDVDGNRVKLWEINRQITDNKWEKGQFSTDLGYDYNVRSSRHQYNLT